GAKKHGADWVNTGGRVLGVTAIGKDTEEARKKAYAALAQISFHGAHFRDDIAGGGFGT
ncbi:MAG: phosphoribosylamine--glycine ligase, partial [Alphaproteobacteria bacterium]